MTRRRSYRHIYGKADDSATLTAIQNAANNGVTYSTVQQYMTANWSPQTPDNIAATDNGFIPTGNLVRIPTEGYGYDVVQKETAVAWAMLIQDAVEYNKTASSDDKLRLNAFSCSDGYRPYADQVRLYAGYYLGLSGYNYAVTPVFDDGTATANAYITQHSTDFIANPTTFISNAIASGDLAGYGTSPHGKGIAIDFNPHDPGSLYYRILDVNQEYNDYLYTAGQRIGYGQTVGPTIDGLTALNEFTGTKHDYGKGTALTKEVQWLAANAGNRGFSPYLNTPQPVLNEENNYAETWHWNYNP